MMVPAGLDVSVIMPCLNEEKFVGGALASLLDGTFPPERMEIVVVDGRSTDRTRQLVEEIAARDPRVRLVDNPRQITPAALNEGIRAARGAIIVRADAHVTYPRNYVERMVRALAETGAEMVGGRQEMRPSDDSPTAVAIALSMSGIFATGSPYRWRRRQMEVDTVTLGSWRRSLFDRVGLFDERLVRNQDNELSSRIRRQGGRVLLVPDVRVQYVPRASFRRLWRVAVEGGMWNAFTQRLLPYTFVWRHFLPGLFPLGVLFCLALVGAGIGLRQHWLAQLAAALLAPYGLLTVGVATAKAVGARRSALAPLVAGALVSHHFCYGWGICKGWWLVATGQWRARMCGRPVDTGRT